jgi:hypothetical protein
VRNFNEIDHIVERIEKWRPPANLDVARREIVRKLVAAGAIGNYFTWKNFDPNDEQARQAVQSLVDSFNRYLPALLSEGPVSVRRDEM